MKFVGVIEGFYGRPWREDQRGRLFRLMAEWGMNTYLYAPKDDLKHRAHWREAYVADEGAMLARLARGAESVGVRFVYALAPGLDLDWRAEHDREALFAKLRHVRDLGVQHFALLFDDIPYAADRARQAAEQADATNASLQFLRDLGFDGAMLFCPTEYCARRAAPDVATSPYLRVIGERLHPDVDVFWTGPEVISVEITAASVREVAGVLRRPPVLWDNLHANDYAPRRAHLGPYAGREAALRAEVAGILSNPNNQFELNFPGLHSLAEYARSDAWSAEASLERALDAWLEHLASPNLTRDDLAMLAHALHLPHALGPRASAVHEGARSLIAEPSASNAEIVKGGRDAFRRVLRALEHGAQRDLLYDLHPFLTDAIEELGRPLRRTGYLHPAEPNGIRFQGALTERLAWDEAATTR
ncbi:beta-N-acetylglucosaminidase domain-containing protein [Deinococcus yavapaiensis]|uniref:Protein O-GlcNAcase/histone acetyltransferase n=1 Tax=Deinococcus yavapaiensis KR-236 TaxID=694435 RepID=A0A318S9C2_9DEIO|nr:beta-N-acetylglucosaminidase domain-containing protein [Deinococcus yavapaiensis]PYE54587.1 protein O-GlcNAcase/histone acetyltransferase [Deinococcus yavapaiensis KR-236]